MKLMYLLATSAVVLVMMASCTRQLMEFLTDPMYSYFL